MLPPTYPQGNHLQMCDVRRFVLPRSGLEAPSYPIRPITAESRFAGRLSPAEAVSTD